MRYVAVRAQWEHTDEEEDMYGFANTSLAMMPPSLRLSFEEVSELRSKLSEVERERDGLRAALRSARDVFVSLRRRAMDPMRSMDAGRVIDAQNVEDDCDDAIGAITALLATPPAGSAATRERP